MVADAAVDRALELIEKGAGNYEYFFSKLGSPAWIEPLSRRGRFRHPPRVEHIDNFVRYPRWPEGEYLLRMAPLAPEQVARAVDPVCFGSDNPIVHQVIVDIASTLPADLAREIAVHETRWVRSQSELFALYPEKAAALVVHLATHGEGGAAVQLASAVLKYGTQTRPKHHGPVSTILQRTSFGNLRPNLKRRLKQSGCKPFCAELRSLS